MRILIFLIVLCLFYRVQTIGSPIELRLYGKTFTVDVGSLDTYRKKFANTERGLQDFYRTFKAENQALPTSLSKIQTFYDLNDYFLLKLCEEISKKTGIHSPVMLQWFVLGELGYQVRIAFHGNSTLLFVVPDNSRIILPRIGRYYCISRSAPHDSRRNYDLINHEIYAANLKIFRFLLTSVDVFDARDSVARTFVVKQRNGQDTVVTIMLSESIIDFLGDYPKLDLQLTFSVPFSNRIRPVVDLLRRNIETLADSSKVNYLMRFIASNFGRSSDDEVFGLHDRWQSPEEFLFYRRGDCEDFAGLLYLLVKMLMDKPIIILTYPQQEHVNIAVALQASQPPNVRRKNLNFYTCELSLGDKFIPVGYYQLNPHWRSFIAGEYLPEIAVDALKK